MSKKDQQEIKAEQTEKQVSQPVKTEKKAPEKVRQNDKTDKKVKKSKIIAFRDYLYLSRAELRKVSWPTYKETKATSLVVLGFVTVMAILLGLVDLALSGLIGLILS